MSQPVNPYAPPTVAAAPVGFGMGGGGNYWVEGDQLVVPRTGATLPDRCVKCNAPATNNRLNKTFQWHPRWIYFLIVISWLIYLILALIMRKTVVVDFALCEEHAATRKTGIMIGWGGGLLSIVLMIVGISQDIPALSILAIIGLIGCIIAGAVMARTMYPTKIDDNYAWMKVGEPFLHSIR